MLASIDLCCYEHQGQHLLSSNPVAYHSFLSIICLIISASCYFASRILADCQTEIGTDFLGEIGKKLQLLHSPKVLSLHLAIQ